MAVAGRRGGRGGGRQSAEAPLCDRGASEVQRYRAYFFFFVAFFFATERHLLPLPHVSSTRGASQAGC